MKTLKVHRINFFEPDPISIRCIAFDKSISRLAVSRADASIEIWDVRKNPYLEKVIPSISEGSIETIAWCNSRLFSAGLSGYVSEYDLTTLSQKYQLLVTTGCPIWCMAVNKQKTCLATGNEDGHVILHDFTSEGLDFQKKFDKQEGCILCLAWHQNGHVIVTGSLDTIRVWDVDTGHVVNRIILGRASKNTATIVWCISILSDMTIVSGDSSAKTSFWDGNTGTLISSRAFHKEDVLAICMREDEEEIYTSGVDPLIQMFRQSHDGMWLKCVQTIVHTHDVRALQLTDNFLVSGGDDCNLVFSKYPPKTTITYFPFCQMSYAAAAPLASCILLRYAGYLEMWRIGSSLSGSNAQKLLQIKSKSNKVITCSSVSPDGKWVAYSTQEEMRLFNINLGESFSDVPVISKVYLPAEISDSASILLFTPDSSKLIVASNGKIFIAKCGDALQMEGIIEAEEENVAQIHRIEISCCGLYLACGNYNGDVIVYSLKSLEVMVKLPQYQYQPTTLKFDPSSENLVVVYSDRKVIEFNLKRETYTDWSKKNFLLNLQEKAYHPITSVVYISDKLFLSDENNIYVFDKSEQLIPHRKKAKNSENSFVGYDDSSYKTITKYQHISSIHALLDDLVVVQIPSHHIENVLPPPIWKKKYGT